MNDIDLVEDEILSTPTPLPEQNGERTDTQPIKNLAVGNMESLSDADEEMKKFIAAVAKMDDGQKRRMQGTLALLTRVYEAYGYLQTGKKNNSYGYDDAAMLSAGQSAYYAIDAYEYLKRSYGCANDAEAEKKIGKSVEWMNCKLPVLYEADGSRHYKTIQGMVGDMRSIWESSKVVRARLKEEAERKAEKKSRKDI